MNLPNSADSNAQNPLFGIFLIIAGLFLFSIQDVIIKSLSGDYAVLQIVFIRSCLAIAILTVILWCYYTPDQRQLHRFWPIGIKASCAFFSYVTYYLAMSVLPIADVATITFSAPIMVTAASALIFHEKVGPRRWIAVLVGFVAVMMVVGPKGHFNNPAVVLALLAAVFYAISTLTTRFIDQRDTATASAFYTVIIFLVWSVIATFAIEIFRPESDSESVSMQFLLRHWEMPALNHALMLVFLGFIATAGFYCLIRAYMVAEFSAVAPFEYSYIIWGVIFGYLFWQEVPSVATFVGIGLLVASNLYILHREATLKNRSAFRKPRLPRR